MKQSKDIQNILHFLSKEIVIFSNKSLIKSSHALGTQFKQLISSFTLELDALTLTQ